jgi:hypothetical protein
MSLDTLWAGSADEAIFWYHGLLIPALGHITPEKAVEQVHAPADKKIGRKRRSFKTDPTAWTT